MSLNTIVESNDYEQGNVESVDSGAIKDLEEFQKYIENAPLTEQVKWANMFVNKSYEYMDSETKDAINWWRVEDVNSANIEKSDEEGVKNVRNMLEEMSKYPDNSPEKKEALDYINDRRRNAEGDVKNTLDQDQNKDKSDKNIEK